MPKIVADAQGEGVFYITRGEGEPQRVQAIEFGSDRSDEYRKEQFRNGADVVVYRSGTKGMCALQVNQKNDVSHLSISGRREVPREKYHDAFFMDVYNKAEIVLRKPDRTVEQIIISFQPSIAQ